jgi:hypothetical protein
VCYVDANPPDDEQHEQLARALDLRGEGTEHRATLAANDAIVIARFHTTLTEHGIGAEEAVTLTLEWMNLGHHDTDTSDEGDA